MSANPVLALVLFALGGSLLWSGWSQWNRLRRVQKIVVRAWQYAETAFGYRREMLPRLLLAVHAARVPGTEGDFNLLWQMAHLPPVDVETNRSRRLAMETEQKISVHLHYLLEACERARNFGPPDSLAALCDEARDREQHISVVREGWNDAAYAVRVYRRTFPAFLLANVLFPHDLPLFVGDETGESLRQSAQ